MSARDPRFDGTFFTGVKTTGIYCRPICPARKPKLDNVTFYPSSAAAEEAGFRPCKRCRPDTAPGSPPWIGTSSTVKRALRLMDHFAHDDKTVLDLAESLGVSDRWLREIFNRQLGANPQSVYLIKKLDQARALLDHTQLPITEIALNTGFRSVRRFNDAFKKRYRSAPREIRKKVDCPKSNEILLNYRPPIQWEELISFFQYRQIRGMELTGPGYYERSFELGDAKGWFRAELNPNRNSVRVKFSHHGTLNFLEFSARMRNLFDLDADPAAVASTLKKDDKIKALARRFPGLRVPGCWDGFELAVRAIVGQQISVRGATTILSRMTQTLGDEITAPSQKVAHLFPTAKRLAAAPVEGIGLTRTRAKTIQDLATKVTQGKLTLDGTVDPDQTREALLSIKGIGPWSTDYIEMRALRNPNSFLDSDLEVKKQIKLLKVDPTLWEPWRSYGLIYLWKNASLS